MTAIPIIVATLAHRAANIGVLLLGLLFFCALAVAIVLAAVGLWMLKELIGQNLGTSALISLAGLPVIGVGYVFAIPVLIIVGAGVAGFCLALWLAGFVMQLILALLTSPFSG